MTSNECLVSALQARLPRPLGKPCAAPVVCMPLQWNHAGPIRRSSCCNSHLPGWTRSLLRWCSTRGRSRAQLRPTASLLYRDSHRGSLRLPPSRRSLLRVVGKPKVRNQAWWGATLIHSHLLRSSSSCYGGTCSRNHCLRPWGLWQLPRAVFFICRRKQKGRKGHQPWQSVT